MLAAQILIQLVSWPLVALLAWAGLRGRTGASTVATVGVVVLVGANALLAIDPTGESVPARICAGLAQCAVAVVFAVFPSGRPVPGWIGWVVGAGIAAQLANLATGLRLEDQAWWPWQYLLTWSLLLGGQITRYRSRADARERQQVRWVLATFLTMVAAFLIITAASIDGLTTIEETDWVAALLLTLPGVGLSLGLLMPTSANLDRVLRWVLAVGGWALLVSATIVVTAAAASAGEFSEAATRWVVAVATAAIAALGWRPAGRLSDRVVYGRRRDPLGALTDLDSMLAAHHDASAVPETVVHVISQAIGAERVEIHAGEDLLAATGTAMDTRLVAFPVVYRGEQLATVAIAPRRGEQALTAADTVVVERVCAYAGPALEGARALVELVESRARTVLAREEERKRLRSYLHDDLAPTFSGLGLSAAALEQYTIAGDARALEVARRLTGELAAATRQLREVAYDLRPPALDDRGLVAALSDRLVIAGSTPAVQLTARIEDARLPAAVEAAAFRIVSEAVMNVRRHAAAQRCMVDLAATGGRLELAVTDDGIGLKPSVTAGVGLRSMRETAAELGGELTVTCAPGGGTVVTGWLPLTREPVA